MKAHVDSGRVRAWGVSNYGAWQILEMTSSPTHARSRGPPVSQVLYNVLHRQLEMDYFAFTYGASPVHTTVYNPLAGWLAQRASIASTRHPPRARVSIQRALSATLLDTRHVRSRRAATRPWPTAKG